MKLDITPDQVAQCVNELGVGFMFALMHHSAMRHVSLARRELGLRTLFNILGPMLGALAISVLPIHGVMMIDVVTAVFAVVPLLSLAAAIVARLLSTEEATDFVVEALDGVFDADLAGVADSVVGGSSGGGGDADWVISGADMYAAVGGSVGIGTASPSAKLDVVGPLGTPTHIPDTPGRILAIAGGVGGEQHLHIGIVPYLSLADDEAVGIIELIRISNAKSLSILEQARLIDELINVHQMGNAEIATLLERSKAWVSVRSGIISQMSPKVMDKIFNGQFPVYSFMYTLRQFMRLNGVKKAEIDDFVDAVAGKHLSTRDIDLLAHAYFKGSDEFREQIKNGNLSWGLRRLKQSFQPGAECTEREQQVLKALEITQKYMRQLILICNDTRLKTNTFYAQANLLSGGILRQLDTFTQAIRQFYDRSGQT